MLRTLIAFLHIISFSFIFSTDVSELKKEEFKAELNTPSTIEKGTDGIVEINFTVSNVKGFAKLTDNFPTGVIVEAVDMGNATFTFSNGVLKIIWLNFPTDKEFSVKYKVKVDKAAPSNFEIGGKFSYLENNEKRSYSVFKKSIATEALAAKTKTEENQEQIASNTKIIRTIEPLGNDNYKVTLDITKQGIEGFCKIQEFTSFGGKMTEGELKGAIFNFIKNKGKFVWMSLPADESFTVSYNLDLSAAKDKDVSILRGDFSFLEGNVTKKVDIVNKGEETLADNSNSSQTEIIEEGNTKETKNTITEAIAIKEPSAPTPTIIEDAVEIAMVTQKDEEQLEEVEEATSTEESTESNLEEEVIKTQELVVESNEQEIVEENPIDAIEEEIVAVEEDIIEETPVLENVELEIEAEAVTKENETPEEVKEIEEEEVVPVQEEKNEEKKPEPVLDNNLGIRIGVNYRVQIAAGKNVVDKAYFKKRHNWTNDFVIENHKGWVKYTTGSYQVYRAARDNRETINGGDHKFNGPFVTAYNEGIRITVQEALMISNQKWFK